MTHHIPKRYYLLQFRIPREHHRDTTASYILTTDADIKFDPKDVQALTLLLSRDKQLGAVCVRNTPTPTHQKKDRKKERNQLCVYKRTNAASTVAKSCVVLSY